MFSWSFVVTLNQPQKFPLRRFVSFKGICVHNPVNSCCFPCARQNTACRDLTFHWKDLISATSPRLHHCSILPCKLDAGRIAVSKLHLSHPRAYRLRQRAENGSCGAEPDPWLPSSGETTRVIAALVREITRGSLNGRQVPPGLYSACALRPRRTISAIQVLTIKFPLTCRKWWETFTLWVSCVWISCYCCTLGK